MSPWKTAEGQWVDRFATRMIDVDEHALVRHMHRPDPKRLPETQDKRIAVILPEALHESLAKRAARELDEAQ